MVLGVLLLNAANAQTCTDAEISDIIQVRTEGLEVCQANYEDCALEGGDKGRRRPEDEVQDLYTPLSCICSNCLSEIHVIESACNSCATTTYEYDEDNDSNAGNWDYDPKDFDYKEHCVLANIIPLQRASNTCNLINYADRNCLEATQNLTLVGNGEDEDQDGERRREDENGEEDNYGETLKQCWGSIFQSSSNVQMNSCANVCQALGTQTCTMHLKMSSQWFEGGLNAYGLSCWSSACQVEDALMIIQVIEDMYVYGQFLEGIEGEERRNSDEDASDGLDLPVIQGFEWQCDGYLGYGTSDPTGELFPEHETVGGNGVDIAGIIFGILFALAMLLLGLYYYKYKEVAGEPLCPPWSDNDHERYSDEYTDSGETEEGPPQGYGAAATSNEPTKRSKSSDKTPLKA